MVFASGIMPIADVVEMALCVEAVVPIMVEVAGFVERVADVGVEVDVEAPASGALVVEASMVVEASVSLV